MTFTTVPEEAVKAAQEAFHEAWNNNQGLDNELPAYAHRAALTAALPFLPVQGAVKKLEWELASGDHYAEGSGTHYNIYETRPDFWNCVTVKPGNVRLATNVSLEAAKAAAQADFEARILSALEPSAARELALDVEFATIRAMIYCYEGDSAQAFEAQKALAKIEYAIRSLSSPDHADAGKVEGDGEKWPMRELIAKAMAYQSVGDPHAKTVHGNQRWEWFVEDADKFINAFGYYLPALPSAPASEGAE